MECVSIMLRENYHEVNTTITENSIVTVVALEFQKCYNSKTCFFDMTQVLISIKGVE